MAATSEDEDLLYNLAYECEALFDHLQDTFRKTTSDVIVALCGEYQQRFAIWAAHLGVFARKSQCLDTRLQNLPDLQDLVARLLDILRRSLQQCTAEAPDQVETNRMMVEIHDLPSGPPQILTTTLKTIDDTLTRLSRLGVTIRQSGRGKLDTRAKRFAAGLDLSPFANLCAGAVQALYPGAHQALKDHLSRSMMDRSAMMLFLDSRHQNLQARREPHIGLPPIQEVRNDEMPTPSLPHRPRIAIRNRAVQGLLRQAPALSESDLSSVNLHQIRSRLRPPDEASTKFHKTSSIQVNQGNYPRIPSTTDETTVITCQWCSEPLIKKTLSESEWRRHIDRDLKPYICLAETCPEAHPAYATFDEWHKHMELHDWRWHQRTYLTSNWVCTICELSSDTYTSPQALYLHLEESHGGDFSHAQLQAISRQSKTEQPRASNDCLLCGFAVQEQGNFGEAVFLKRRRGRTKQETSKSARKTLEMAHPSPHNSDSELSDTSSESDDMGSDHRKKRSKGRSTAVSRHVAVHLQVLMLLTLRFAAALQENGGDAYDDTKSDSVDIDEGDSASEGADLGRLSNITSEDVTMKDESDGKSAAGDVVFDESLDDDIAADEMPVPDTDIDLEFIPRQYDNLAVEDDEFLNELIESGDFLPEEDLHEKFSISRAIMTATRVALVPVNVIEGISFDFLNDGGAGGGGEEDGDELSSQIEDHISDTSHENITTQQLPDELGESDNPIADTASENGQGAHSTTMTNVFETLNMENIEGALIAKGVTISDPVIGKGRAVKYGDTVRVSCVARLQNGEGFDASWNRDPSFVTIGKPGYRLALFNEVFPGWDVGVIGMAVGGERRLTIPAHLADAKNMQGAPSNCQLTYDIKLLEIWDVIPYGIKLAEILYGSTEADLSGLGAHFSLGPKRDEPLKEAVQTDMDHHQHKPSPLSPGWIQTNTDRYNVEFVEAQNPAGMELWPRDRSLKASGVGKWESPPSEPDIASSDDEDRKAKGKISLAQRFGKYLRPEKSGEAEEPTMTEPVMGLESDIEHGVELSRPPGEDSETSEGWEDWDSSPTRRSLAASELLTVNRRRTREKRRSDSTTTATSASNLTLRPAPDQQLENLSTNAPSSVSERGPGEEAQQTRVWQKAEEESDSDGEAMYPGNSGKRAKRAFPQFVSGVQTHQLGVPQEADQGPKSPTRSLHDAEEDTGPRLKRVGHVQFDELVGVMQFGDIAESRASNPSSSDDDTSEEGEESTHPPIPPSDNEMTNDDIEIPPRRSTLTENPPQKKVVASAGVPAEPPTPVTSREMDSEEEYMSPMSSDDEIMLDGSGDEVPGAKTRESTTGVSSGSPP